MRQSQYSNAVDICLERNNFLFAGFDDGGERAADIYTLIRTAKLNGLDPKCYLRSTSHSNRVSAARVAV